MTKKQDDEEKMAALAKHLKVKLDRIEVSEFTDRVFEVVAPIRKVRGGDGKKVDMRKIEAEYMVFAESDLVKVGGFFFYKVP